MTKIFIFTTSVEHTTHRKAALLLDEAGAEVKYVGFTRNNFPEGNLGGLSVDVLGSVRHGNYGSRLLLALKNIFRIRALSKDCAVVYCFTLDGMLICRLSLFLKRIKYVYQVQDVRPVFFEDNWKGVIARFLERQILKKVSLLVLSSFDFYVGHFGKLYTFDENRVVTIENKLTKETEIKIKNRRREARSGPIRFGYFGVMRCQRSWEILYQLAEQNPTRIYLSLRGKAVAMPDLRELIFDKNNITYKGVYKSPEELNEVYEDVDIVWACYPYSNKESGNWRMARTIRYYEALAFGKPVIVQKGSAQENEVIKYQIGLVVDMSCLSETILELSKITRAQIQCWADNISKLPGDYMFHRSEHVQLLNRLSLI